MSFAIVLFTPITVAVRRAKASIFTRPSILFRPHVSDWFQSGGAAGYRPRVRSVYYMCVYRHSSVRNTLHIGDPGGIEKRRKRNIEGTGMTSSVGDGGVRHSVRTDCDSGQLLDEFSCHRFFKVLITAGHLDKCSGTGDDIVQVIGVQFLEPGFG